MNEDLIEKGDIIDIYFVTHGYIFKALVIGVPDAPGSAFIVKASEGGIIYVQSYEKVELVAKGVLNDNAKKG